MVCREDFLPSTVSDRIFQYEFRKHQTNCRLCESYHMSCDMTFLNSFQIMNAASYVVCLPRLQRFTAESLFKFGRILNSHERQLEKLHVQSICLNCLLTGTAYKCLMFLIMHRMLLGLRYRPSLKVTLTVTEE